MLWPDLTSNMLTLFWRLKHGLLKYHEDDDCEEIIREELTSKSSESIDR